jgi:translation elongation factor P/translation initiation factor 5A
MLFVVVNFVGEERDVRINLTHHLFEAMGCDAFGKVVAEDMMSGDKAELNFSADEPVEVVLKPYQVCAYSVLL